VFSAKLTALNNAQARCSLRQGQKVWPHPVLCQSGHLVVASVQSPAALVSCSALAKGEQTDGSGGTEVAAAG
jgi:hypothetical protein